MAINVLKHLVNSLVNKFGTNSKYTSLLTLHANIRIYAINLSWSLNDKMYQEHTFVIDMVTLLYKAELEGIGLYLLTLLIVQIMITWKCQIDKLGSSQRYQNISCNLTFSAMFANINIFSFKISPSW